MIYGIYIGLFCTLYASTQVSGIISVPAKPLSGCILGVCLSVDLEGANKRPANSEEEKIDKPKVLQKPKEQKKKQNCLLGLCLGIQQHQEQKQQVQLDLNLNENKKQQQLEEEERKKALNQQSEDEKKQQLSEIQFQNQKLQQQLMEQERLQEQLMQRQQRHQKLQQELALQQHKLQQEKDLNEQQVQLQQKLLRQQEQLLQQQKLQQKELQQLDSSIVQIPLYQGLQISPQVLQLIQQSRNVLAPQQNGQFPTPVAVQPQQHAPILEGPTNPDDFTEETIERDSKLTTVELIAQYHYPVETHYVTTGDGYVLCLHRIPRPDSQPILLVHGLMSSSASWVQMGPRNGLAYILFRRGYDVWMLNTRGNVYSKKHSNPRIKPSSYWSFSFHEIGKFDLPATIDFILNTTGLAKVQYIGHSQGCTAFFVMCSERRGYAKKISLMQALSPTTYMKHTRSPVLQFLSLFKHRFTVMLNLLGGFQLSLNTHLIRLFRKDICNEKTSPICSVFDFIVCGFDWKQFNETLAPLVLGHVSQGASTKQIYHYAQLHGVKKFQQFDHGSTANLQIYRQMTPPTYNLSAVTCKVALHYGSNDWLSSEKDVNRLYSNLPNCIENRQIDFPQFSHYDFTISKDVRPLVYNRVCDLVKQYAYVG